MDEDEGFKHVCKLCSRSFDCGRSLGGHMRSQHKTQSNNTSAETDDKKTKKKKKQKQLVELSTKKHSVITGTITTSSQTLSPLIGDDGAGYGLRENPKKTWRILGVSEVDASPQDKFCRECGKGFSSWKALFGHMKCHSHSDREKGNDSGNFKLEDRDSRTSDEQKLVMDSESEDEAAVTNIRRQRSKRRTRYRIFKTSTSSSPSLVNNASSCVSEIEEQEEGEDQADQELALCLMMLSRDVVAVGHSHRGTQDSSVAESSDHRNEVKAKRNLSPDPISNKDVSVKLEKLKVNKFESGPSRCAGDESFQLDQIKTELYVPGKSSRNRSKMPVEPRKSDAKGELTFKVRRLGMVKDSAAEVGTNGIEQNSFKSNQKKRKFCEFESGEAQNSDERSEFECTTCNRTFHSYQALGGHKASHKRTKDKFGSKMESTEHRLDTESSPDSVKYREPPCRIEKDDVSIGLNSNSNKSMKHECPICLRVFASGQALGGHKRSHSRPLSHSHPLGSDSTSEAANSHHSTAVPKRISEIQGLLDLNLPAPTKTEEQEEEEDEGSNHVSFSSFSWWVGSHPIVM